MPSVSEAVYKHLRVKILTDLPPGAPLNLRELASELGVSTTPVRAAIESLIGDGLVVRETYKSARVAHISLRDMLDIYAVREGLEGIAAKLGASRLSSSDIEGMQARMSRLTDLRDKSVLSIDLYLELEWSVREICYRAAGHDRLFGEIGAYRRQAERYFRLALAQGFAPDDDLELEEGFFEACVARDGESADRLARALLTWTRDRVIPLLERELANPAVVAPDRVWAG